jgi:trigger factor
MQVTREDLNPCTIQLSVVCDESQVKDGYEKAVKQLAKKVRIPGFRPGMAPKAMIEQMIVPADLDEQAADNIVRVAYKNAIEQESLTPYSQPSVELTSLDRSQNKCDMVIKVPLAPIIELGDYSGLTAKRPPLAVTEAEIESQIEEMRRRLTTREAVTGRGVQQGDVAVVNIKFEGDESEDRTFMTMVGQTFTQLDEALAGMETEQMKSVDLTFPDNFQEKDWAGKSAKCQVTLRALSEMKLPELDDAFAKEYQAENLDELKVRVREGMGRAKENFFQEYINEQLLEELRSISKVHVPDNMWANVANQRLQDIDAEQRKKDSTLEEYAKSNNMTVEELVKAQQNEAKVQVERAVMVREIFAKEKMQLTNEDLTNELLAMSREYQMEPKDLANALKKNQAIDELHFRAIYRKVLAKITETAKIVEEEAPKE